MKKKVFFFLIIAFAAIGGYLAWQFGISQQVAEDPPAEIATPEEEDTAPETSEDIRYPVPETTTEVATLPSTETDSETASEQESTSAQAQDASPPSPDELDLPVPDLNESDSALRNILARFFPRQKIDELFRLDNFIKRAVVTIDMFPQKKVPPRLLPYQPASGSLAVEGQGEVKYITAQNGWRYRSFIKLVDAVDTQKAVEWYVHFYPLFQEAYQNLGYPDRYFNDRLVEVIDHLLDAPEIQEPIPVVQHVVHYRFRDPELEALSAGQKLMIRIGTENARIIKSKLRTFREALIALSSSE